MIFRVYCGTFGKYNDGDLSGDWLNLSDFVSYDVFLEACKELHKDESDPEFMFQDVEQECEFFDGEPSLSEIRKWYELWEVCRSEEEFIVTCDYIHAYSYTLSADTDMWELHRDANDRVCCEVDGWDAHVWDLIEDYLCSIGAKDFNLSYFDYDAYKRDLEYDVTFGDEYVFFDR